MSYVLHALKVERLNSGMEANTPRSGCCAVRSQRYRIKQYTLIYPRIRSGFKAKRVNNTTGPLGHS